MLMANIWKSNQTVALKLAQCDGSGRNPQSLGISCLLKVTFQHLHDEWNISRIYSEHVRMSRLDERERPLGRGGRRTYLDKTKAVLNGQFLLKWEKRKRKRWPSEILNHYFPPKLPIFIHSLDCWHCVSHILWVNFRLIELLVTSDKLTLPKADCRNTPVIPLLT